MICFIFAQTQNINETEALNLVDKYLQTNREESVTAYHVDENGNQTKGLVYLKKTPTSGDYVITLDEPFHYRFKIQIYKNRILAFCIPNKVCNKKTRPQDISSHPISLIFKGSVQQKTISHYFEKNGNIFTFVFFTKNKPGDKLVMSFNVNADKSIKMLAWTIQSEVSKRHHTGLRVNVLQHLIINYQQPIKFNPKKEASIKARLLKIDDHFSYRELLS